MRILVSNNTRKADLQRLLRRRGGELSAARFFCDDCNREHQSFELATRCHATGTGTVVEIDGHGARDGH